MTDDEVEHWCHCCQQSSPPVIMYPGRNICLECGRAQDAFRNAWGDRRHRLRRPKLYLSRKAAA